jgi:hypothetical protein
MFPSSPTTPPSASLSGPFLGGVTNPEGGEQVTPANLSLSLLLANKAHGHLHMLIPL